MIQLFVIFSFVAWTIALLGIGSFFNLFLSKYFKDFKVTPEIRLLYFGTLGFIIVSIIGTLFNFFIPLGQIFSTIILLVGLILFSARRKDILTF